MATREWLGNAPATRQVRAWVIGGTWEATDVITVTIGYNSVTMVAGSTAIDTIGAALATALNASTIPEFAEITWAYDSATNTLTGTADTAGKPFEASITTTETGGGTADDQTIDGSDTSAGTDTTACTGPNHLDNPANWSGGALPVDSDDVVIARGVSIKHGLDGLDDVTPASLKIYSAFWANGATIGLPRVNGTGSAAYYEYRGRFLKFLGATTVDVGLGESRGSTMLNLDFMTGNVAVTVHNTGTSNDASRKTLALNMLPSNVADGTLEVIAGSVGVGMYGETCKCTSRIGWRSNQTGDAQVYFGPGVTHGATNQMSGGTVEINTATTLINKTGGELTLNGTGAHPSVSNWEGALYVNSTGAIIATKGVIGGKGIVSFERDISAKNIDSAWEMYEGAQLFDRLGVCDVLSYKAMGCGNDKVKVYGPPNKTWTAS